MTVALKKLISLATLLLAGCAVSFAQYSVVDISQLYEDGRFDQAVAVADSCIVVNPEDDAAHYYRGMSLMRLGRAEEAEASLINALALDPDNRWYYEPLFNYYYYLSYYQGQRGDLLEDIALRMCDRFPSHYAQIPLMKFISAEAYRRRGNTAAYFANITEAVQSEELDADMKANYLDSVLKLVDGPTYRVWHPQLDSVVNACVATHPLDSAVLKMAGLWYYRCGRPEEGKKHFAQWEKAYPSSVAPQQIFLEIAVLEDDDEEFLYRAGRIMSMDPSTKASMLCSIADRYSAAGDKKTAYKYYEKSLKADKSYAVALNNYAYFLSLDGKKLSKAEKMAREVIRQYPDNATYLDTLAWILHLRGKDIEAKAVFQHAFVYGGRESEAVLEHYADVLDALGENSRAVYYRNLAKTYKK